MSREITDQAWQVNEHLWVELIAADPEDDPIEAYVAVADRMTGDATTLDVTAIPALIRALRLAHNKATGVRQ